MRNLFVRMIALVAPLLSTAQAAPIWTADLPVIRQMATLLPGPRAVRINVIKIAESRRTKNFAVKGAPPEASVQARTAYQVVFPDGYIMIDSGMDLQIHKFFGRGAEEPFYPEANTRLQSALLGAKSIVFTHEHADHVAGVIHSPNAAVLASKSYLTRAQLETLLNNPQVPEIQLTPELARRFVVFDYDQYLPFAAGFVMIKAPGHTPGSQMFYVVLQSGQEYLFAGDVAWHMDGIQQMRGKDASWVKEDEAQIAPQLQWLNAVLADERNVHIVVSHDEDQRLQYIRAGVLGDGLELPPVH